MDIEKYKNKSIFNAILKVERKGSIMSVQINKTTFTPEQQAELQKRLGKAKSREEAQAIFDAYKKEVGLVDNPSDAGGNASVQRAEGAKPVKGTVVERTANRPKGEVVGKPTSTYTVPSSMIMERMGLTDDNLKAEFMKFLGEQKNLKLDKDGNISFDQANKTALNDALQAFAEQHKANFVDPNADKYVEFTEDSAPEIINKLGEDGAIGDKPVSERRYAVNNEEALRQTLDNKVGETRYEKADARSASVEAGLTTTTTTRENILDVPENLRESRKDRKDLREKAEQEYANLAANADPELRSAIDLYIAERKYNKKIDKKMAEMLEYKTTIGGTKEKKIQRDDADIVQLYINKYADEKDRAALNALVNNIQNSPSENDQRVIMDALKDSNIIGVPDSFDKLTPELKKKGALISMSKAFGYEPKTLLRLMATHDVMKDRTAAEIAKDDKYFAEQQAKDYVKNQQAEQDIPNTTVHFSKEARKTLKYKGPYIALAIFIITLIPHIKWLINNDFITLTYMLKRGSPQEYFILNHLIYPLKFFFAQFILIIPLLIIFIIHKNKFNKITLNKFFSPSNDKTFFINCITFLPLIITMLGSFIGAVSLKSMWGTPMLFMTGIWLFYNFKIKTNNDTEIIFKKFIQYTYIISIIYAVIFVLIVITTPSLKFNINQDLLVNKSIDIWKTHTGNKPIIYTGGDMWIASIVAVNLERKTNQKIKTFIEMNLDKNSWVNDKILSDIKNKGIIVFANTKDEFDSYTNNFPNLKLIDIIEIKSDNIFNKSKSTKLFIGILRGEKW